MNQLPYNKLPPFIHQEGDQLWLVDREEDSVKVGYRIEEIIYSEQSEFQHVMVCKNPTFGRMLVLDGIVQTTANDGYIYNEMITHVPLAYHPDPKRVLIIGGGDCGAAREICKYEHVEQIDMVEIDETVVRVCREHLPEVSGKLDDPRVRFIFEDGVKFAAKSEPVYDVIIVDSSDPIGPAVQLFELDFYRNLHNALKPGGILVCQTESPVFHWDVLNRSYSNIRSLFAETKLYTAVVPTYPGGFWSFTMGLKSGYGEFKVQRELPETRYVNADILKNCFELPNFIANRLK